MHSGRSLAFLETLDSQEREESDLDTNNGLLDSVACKAHRDSLIQFDGRERGGANTYVSNILPYFIGHLPTKMMARRMRPVPAICFLVDFGVYNFDHSSP